VRDFEPDVALYGGDDGLGILSRVMVEAAERLRTGGYLLCEFGYGQDIEIEALIDQTAGLTFLEFKRDLQGIARTAVIKRTP
jgi:release factor glutamine methyltransferase